MGMVVSYGKGWGSSAEQSGGNVNLLCAAVNPKATSAIQ
jgi:hypothetical protein